MYFLLNMATTSLASLACLICSTLVQPIVSDDCISVEPLEDRTLHDDYCKQPLFVNFELRSDQIEMVDNICRTYFPLPDDPDTYTVYLSTVYCDGSNSIRTYIVYQESPGVTIHASPDRTFQATTFSYPGCDTYLSYIEPLFGDSLQSSGEDYSIYGLSTQCRSLPLSCLSKVEEEIEAQGFPEQDYYILPMKLPHRCVTQQLCTQPPNPFYNELPAVSPVPLEVLPGPAVLGPGPGVGVFPGPGLIPEPVPYPGPNTGGFTSGPKLVAATGPHLVAASGPTVTLI